VDVGATVAGVVSLVGVFPPADSGAGDAAGARETGGEVVAGAAFAGAESPEVALGSVAGAELLVSVPLSVFVARGCGTTLVSSDEGCDSFTAVVDLVLDAAGLIPAFAMGPFVAAFDSSRTIFDSVLNL
jgi:hypothetical protein